jgi:hypothetical protein
VVCIIATLESSFQQGQAIFKPVTGAVELPQSKLAAGGGAVTAETLQARLPPGGCGPLAVEVGDGGAYAIAPSHADPVLSIWLEELIDAHFGGLAQVTAEE